MKIDITQGTTQRGIVKVLACVAASWAWFSGDINQATGALTLASGVLGFLGIADKE